MLTTSPGFTPELENAPKHAFRESDTGKDVLKREEDAHEGTWL
jgi:hypothetical protein